ncbi:hypothetical protein R5R35_007797 [Gryllus longicercus]|uniref:Cytochrome P450 n=1 Tax=Gryllus longicercus TaxID=2509291 RepID=A0AAN9WW87_9ORTH
MHWMQKVLSHQMLLSNQKYAEKGFLYKVLNLWLGTGLVTSGGEKWRSRRKALTPAFHFKIVDQFVQVFNSCGDEFVRQLRKQAGDADFNVYPPAELFTLDVICEAAMGVKINAQTQSNSSYVNAVRQVSSMTISRVFQPWYIPDFIFLNSPIGRKYKKMLKILHGTTQMVIQERREELEKIWSQNTFMNVDELGRRRRIAFLDLLLWNARDGSISDADIGHEVETFMFAGHDTTASALTFTMLLLSRHMDAQDKILKELESVFDPQQPLELSLQKLSELKYLEMVVKESLRIYPPVPVFNRRNPEDTALVSGHVMPEGCSITISPFGIHRDPEIFPEPERFIPERFSPEESARRHPYAYIPFSAGPRNCIGQRFAMLELKSVLAKVVWNFRLLPAPDFEPELTWELTLQSANGIHVRLQDRKLN